MLKFLSFSLWDGCLHKLKFEIFGILNDSLKFIFDKVNLTVLELIAWKWNVETFETLFG